mgnify:CR=1 FL=1
MPAWKNITLSLPYKDLETVSDLLSSTKRILSITIIDRLPENKSHWFDQPDKKLILSGKTHLIEIFLEKNKGFARILSREALGPNEQNVIDAVNQFYERLDLSIKQILSPEKDTLNLTSGQSAHLITSIIEGTISRFIRNKFKEIPSNYIENYWAFITRSIFKA